nr:endolytic transglycosylase MltG [Microcella alkalica]
MLGLGGLGVWLAWSNFEPQIRELLGIELPNDYEGDGNGQEVLVTIVPGDIGEDVALTLQQSGVTMSFSAFYDLLLADSSISFQPGTYSLQGEMSAQAALDALLDPANRVENRVTIPEGTVLPETLELLALGTGLPIEDFQAAIADPTRFGVPADAPSIEGYLFPATYTFDPGVTAEQVIERLASEMTARLDALGIPAEDRYRVLTLASVVQREAGSDLEDFGRVARVFTNRIDEGMLLQSDATVHYGTQDFDSVFTTDAERADASNPYNTYANPGLPIGPIGAPGDAALEAAAAPPEGEWLYFVTVNLATGETVFSETLAQHEAAVRQLQEWCNASEENRTVYCD